MNFSLKSISTYKLSKNQIRTICVLKNQKWKYGIRSQLIWFKENVKRNDIHNLLYVNIKLIGYTLLRKRTCNINKMKNKSKYLLFDTLIIDKKYRGKKLSNLMMFFNDKVIKKTKNFSFLRCNKKLINFYKKFDWIKLKTSNFAMKRDLFSSYGMIFNQQNPKDTKYYFYINK